MRLPKFLLYIHSGIGPQLFDRNEAKRNETDKNLCFVYFFFFFFFHI